MFRKGHVPVVGVNRALPVIDAAGADGYESITMPLSLALADRCDAILRIGGPSPGADREVERLWSRGGTGYRSVDEAPDANASHRSTARVLLRSTRLSVWRPIACARRRRRLRHAVRAAVAAVTVALLTARADPAAAGREIPLVRDGSLYRVSVTLNGWLVRPFIVDTGASEVQLSSDVLRALFPPGSVPPVELPGGTYGLADGRVTRNRRVLISSLRIGDRELRQVTASVEGPGTSLLLGQNVLSRLGAWSIDYRRSALVLLDEPPHQTPRAGCADWRTAPGACEVAVVRDYLRSARPPHEVTRLRLLRSDGTYAAVFVDAVREGRAATARLCGPMELRRSDAGSWRVYRAAGLRVCRAADPRPDGG